MSDDALELAKHLAFDLLQRQGTNEARFARRPTIRDAGDPDRMIAKALAEGHRVLNRASKRALSSKIATLKAGRARQLMLNYVHFATGSTFVLLIAGKFPGTAEWVGAVVAFCAGTISVLLPTNVAGLEQELLKDTEHIAQLSGDIGELQVTLLTERPSQNAELSKKVAEVIGQCLAVAKQYELEAITSRAHVFSRSRERG